MKRFDPINEHIRYPEVQVIDPEGKNLGTMSSRRANEIAASYDLDLYCVAPNANPPVCKILNYGKFRFEQEKAERENRKKSKGAELKEIQLHISIGEHDLQTKLKKSLEFLAEGDKVNVRVILKGREMAHQEIGEALFHRFVDLLGQAQSIALDKTPKWEGKCYSAIVQPKGNKK
ncbi:MAG: translation initiation factor IF-3 [Bacilli bacterium]|nr:translation initiation factor IF-3 [Bacilli bacterium]